MQLFIKFINWWTGVVWIIVMFLSAVWTLILTAPIHCRASIAEAVMCCYISPNLMTKQTHLHLGLPEDEYIFSNFSFLGEVFLEACWNSVSLTFTPGIEEHVNVFIMVMRGSFARLQTLRCDGQLVRPDNSSDGGVDGQLDPADVLLHDLGLPAFILELVHQRYDDVCPLRHLREWPWRMIRNIWFKERLNWPSEECDEFSFRFRNSW